ncbi:DUF7146 domain-containing protein [Roseibium sp.]|uniref:DUF7146 domain-containing protein n=1 Tax=Roseibium sp. TaxID=1936156 RepID=UPI003BA9197B
MLRLSSNQSRLRGNPTHDGILIPGPGHSGSDRSLHVSFKPTAPDGFLVHSFAGDDPIECRKHVRELLGVSGSKPIQPLATSNRKQTSQTDRTAFAQRIWDQSRSAIGSPVEAYLLGRGLSAVPETAALRFHPACPFGGEKVAALIAPVFDVKTNTFRAIHRTRLNPKDKKMLGPVGGGCVKLSPDEDVLEGLHICEGIETGLALLAAGFRPLWSCLSAGGMRTFPILSGIEALTVFADNDKSGTGQAAAAECAGRWHDAGREVRILAPKVVGTDFADRRAA